MHAGIAHEGITHQSFCFGIHSGLIALHCESLPSTAPRSSVSAPMTMCGITGCYAATLRVRTPQCAEQTRKTGRRSAVTPGTYLTRMGSLVQRETLPTTHEYTHGPSSSATIAIVNGTSSPLRPSTSRCTTLEETISPAPVEAMSSS